MEYDRETERARSEVYDAISVAHSGFFFAVMALILKTGASVPSVPLWIAAACFLTASLIASPSIRKSESKELLVVVGNCIGGCCVCGMLALLATVILVVVWP